MDSTLAPLECRIKKYRNKKHRNEIEYICKIEEWKYRNFIEIDVRINCRENRKQETWGLSGCFFSMVFLWYQAHCKVSNVFPVDDSCEQRVHMFGSSYSTEFIGILLLFFYFPHNPKGSICLVRVYFEIIFVIYLDFPEYISHPIYIANCLVVRFVSQMQINYARGRYNGRDDLN